MPHLQQALDDEWETFRISAGGARVAGQLGIAGPEVPGVPGPR